MAKQNNNKIWYILGGIIIFILVLIIISMATNRSEVCGNGYCRGDETCLNCNKDCGECPYEYKFSEDFTVTSASMNGGLKACEDKMYKQGHEKTKCYVLSTLSLCFGTAVCDSYEIKCRCEF